MQPFGLTLSVKIQPGQQGVKSSLILIHVWHSFRNKVPMLGSWWRGVPITLPQLWHRLATTLPISTDFSRREVVTESIFLSQTWLICLYQFGGRTARAHSRTSLYDILRKQMKMLLEFKDRRTQLVSQTLHCTGQVIVPYTSYFAYVY